MNKRTNEMQEKNSSPHQRRYSESFKIKIVREYERGHQTKDYLMNKYGIRGHSSVLEWCRKYGKLSYPQRKTIGRPMKDPEKQRIKDLEYELKKVKEKLIIYEKILELEKRESGLDLLKNINTKLSKNWQAKNK